MNTIQETARKTGILYFLFAIVAIIDNFFISSGFVVSDDAAATARNILTSEPIYRISILSGFVTNIFFMVVVLRLYELFKDVDRKQALLMVILVVVGIAVTITNLILRMAPLVLLKNDAFMPAFTQAQLEVMALGFLRLRAAGSNLVQAFWGLWLFPFGILAIRSGYFPKILGVCLFLAGFGYMADSIVSIAWPAYVHAVNQIISPLYFGELPIVFWLMIKGAKAPQKLIGVNA